MMYIVKTKWFNFIVNHNVSVTTVNTHSNMKPVYIYIYTQTQGNIKASARCRRVYTQTWRREQLYLLCVVGNKCKPSSRLWCVSLPWFVCLYSPPEGDESGKQRQVKAVIPSDTRYRQRADAVGPPPKPKQLSAWDAAFPVEQSLTEELCCDVCSDHNPPTFAAVLLTTVFCVCVCLCKMAWLQCVFTKGGVRVCINVLTWRRKCVCLHKLAV